MLDMRPSSTSYDGIDCVMTDAALTRYDSRREIWKNVPGHDDLLLRSLCLSEGGANSPRTPAMIPPRRKLVKTERP